MRLLLTLSLLSGACWSQTFDPFGGAITYSDGSTVPLGPGGPNAQAATCSQSTTNVTCTVVDGTKYAIGEPMAVTGTSTALDWSSAICAANLTQSQCNGLKITNIVSNTLTLSNPVSQTVTSHSGTIKPMRWYVSTTGGRVRINTPLDHWFFAQQVVQAAATAIAKYGSNSCNTAKDEFIAWDSLGNTAGNGFNSTGESNSDDSYYDGGACNANPRIPFQTEEFTSNYCTNNLAQGSFAGVAQPCKDMNYALTPNYVCQGISRASLDFFDPIFEAYVQGWMGGSNSFPNFRQSAFNMGVDFQDSGIGGAAPTNSGWPFNTQPTGKNDCHQSFVVLATAPIQTGSKNVLYSGSNAPYGYTDPKVYMKTSATFNPYGNSTTGSAPGTCTAVSIATICSLQDYLTLEYGTIGALNTAWGTSYTTFGTSGTIVLAEAIGTGDGVTTSFAHNFANAHVDPLSIQIRVAGTPVGFDCPTAGTSCPAAGAGKGTFTAFHGGTISGGVVTYSTGAATNLTFSSAPANGAAITAYYEFNGWGSGNGTGLLDEDGTHMGANGVCPFLPPAFQTSHAYNVGDEISDATSVSWQYVMVAGTSAGSAPTFSATTGTNTVSGGVTFKSLGAPVCGTGGQYTGALPNATMGADLDAYLRHVGAAYFSALKTALQVVAPDLPNWCANQLGVWQSPPNQGILQAASTWCDVAMGDLWDPGQDGAGPAKYDFFTRYYSGPITNYQFPVTSQSAYPCNGNFPCFATQQLKGQWWYTLTNYWLTQAGHTGLKQAVGIQWGGNIDNSSGQGSSDGFETDKFNPYNGHDDVTASVACSFNAFTCGSESSASWNGTDSITHAGCGSCIADATKLWLINPSVAAGFHQLQGGTWQGGTIH